MMRLFRQFIVAFVLVSLTPMVATAQETCTAFLFQEHAARDGFSCPALPTLSTTGVVFAEPPGKRGRVRDIIDGDTLRISFGERIERVRIFSVDTPETYAGAECYGTEATAHTASLIPAGTVIWLERGLTERDRYDRSLYYVWYQEGDGRYRLLQDAIVRDGYGVVDIYPPDDLYEEWLLVGEQDALEHGRGLWSMCGDARPDEPATNQALGIAASSSCDPSYPDVCIPPVSEAGDLDCGDIPDRRFTVLPPDPHNFDGDGNGIGCEAP